MIKNSFIILLKILVLIVFILIGVAVELSFNFLVNGSFIYLRFLIYILLLFLSFIIVKKKGTAVRDNNKRFFSILIISILITVCTLEVWTYVSDKRLGIAQFRYPAATCTQFLRGAMSNSIVENGLEKITKNFSYPQRYMFNAMTDACRVFRIKESLQDEDYRKNLCRNYEKKSECLKEIIDDGMVYRPYSESGIILFTAVGAMNIFEEKENREPKKHPMLTNELKVRFKTLNILYSSSDILELMIIVNELSHQRTLKSILSEFPDEEIARISPEDRKKLDKALEEEFVKDDTVSSSFISMYPGYKKVAPSVSEDVIEAYFIKNVDNEIAMKFESVGCRHSKDIYEKIKSKLASDDMKNITDEEVRSVNLKLERYKRFEETCKKIVKEESENSKLRNYKKR